MSVSTGIKGVEAIRPLSITITATLNLIMGIVFIILFIASISFGGLATFFIISWWSVPLGQFVGTIISMIFLMIGILAIVLSYGLYQLSTWSLTPAILEFWFLTIFFGVLAIATLYTSFYYRGSLMELGLSPGAILGLTVISVTLFAGVSGLTLSAATYLSSPIIKELFGKVEEALY